MATFLALSSSVARGHVGLSAMLPVLHRLGHEVIALPTIVLSNHPGHSRAAGLAIPPERLESMLDALEANGWLADVDQILTGYLPSPEHVALAAHMVARVRARRSDARFLCDPVLGDRPQGLYIDPAAASALRDILLPLADDATPNAFELSWLTGRDVLNPAEAVTAARALPCPAALVTSVTDGPHRLANVLALRDTAHVCSVARLAHVPHGTGDVLTALLAAELTQPSTPAACLGRAVGRAAAIVAASEGRDELALISTPWADAPILSTQIMP